jgi:hypothetical protein
MGDNGKIADFGEVGHGFSDGLSLRCLRPRAGI